MKKVKNLFRGLFGNPVNPYEKSVKEQEHQSEKRNICFWSKEKKGANVSVLNLKTKQEQLFQLPEDKNRVISLLENGAIKIISYSER